MQDVSMTASTHGRFNLFMIMAGVFLVSFSGLMLEITITRIFSTTIWYHYAFMAISVALFGWGLGGLFLYFLRRRFTFRALNLSVVLALIFSISIPVYVWGVFQFPMSPSYLNFYYLASIIPFLLGGMCVSLLFDYFAHSANKIYFADLIGASFGSLSLEPALILLGAESTALILGVTASVAGVFLALASKKRKLVALSLIGLTITSFVFLSNSQYSTIGISNAPSKTMFQDLKNHPESHIVLTKWNSFSRIDVVEGQPDSLATIYIDADALTHVLNWDGDVKSAEYLKETMDFIPYHLVDRPTTLIVGSGGGRDIIISLVGESSEVIAVELNPIIVGVTRSYGNRAGSVYDQNKVMAVVDEGRSFISRSTEKYDIIVLTLVDSWAAIASGGYALAENYLYTLEAFEQYLNHLTDGGILIMIRWHNEIPRLVSTAVVAFQTKGKSAQEAGKHIAIVLDESDEKVRSLFMVRKTPFNKTDVEEIEKVVRALGPYHRIRYAPYSPADEPYSSLFNGTISLDQFYSSFSYPVEPVTDDAPYFFNWERPIPKSLSDLIKLTLFLAIIIIGLPWIIKKRRSTKHTGCEFSFVVYFSALGLAYMLLEIALIQKFILFLGYPTRALSVIIFSLLLSSGIGSFLSRWISKREVVTNILLACPLILILVTSYILFIPFLFEIFLQQETMIRILVTITLLFPLGFLMGIPFPTGVRILAASSSQSVPWMWGINGAMSVLGSVLATAIGILWGFKYAMIVGALAYLIALLCAGYWRSQSHRKNFVRV